MILNGIHKFNIMTRLKIRGADRERVSGERTCLARHGKARLSVYSITFRARCQASGAEFQRFER